MKEARFVKNKTRQAPSMLDSLLRPRTVKVVGRRRLADPIRVGKKLLRGAGPAELVLIASSSNISASVARAAAHAGAVVVLPATGGSVEGLHGHPAAVLGPGAGVWSPTVRAGISAPPFRVQERRPTLVVTQSRAAAQHLMGAASGRKLRLSGAICTGAGGGPTSWIAVVEAASTLDPAPVILLQLQRRVTVAALARVAALEADVVLMLGRPLPLAGLDGPLPRPDQADAARALGLVVVRTAQEAVEASFLLGRGVRRRGAVVKAVAAGEDEATQLQDALWRGGVDADLAPPARIPGGRAAARRVDCLLLGGAPATEHAAVCLTLESGFTPAPGQAVEATLGAVAALQGSAGWRPGRSPRRPRVRVAEARRLLDGWPGALHELQVKELLRCYDLLSPSEELVSSSSGASRAARRIGFPVAVKALGPQLQQRQPREMVALDVRNESAVRQAFREVINACGALAPSPLLEGVLVSAMVPLPAALDCALCWTPQSPALLLARGRVAHLSTPPHVLFCPAAVEDCEGLSAELLHGIHLPDVGAHARHLARFLSRISWLGADLQGRMRWLRLDTISPPTARRAPLVIDGYCEQTESFRAPEF